MVCEGLTLAMAVTTQPLHPVRVFIYIISTVVQVTIEGTPLPPLRIQDTFLCARVGVFMWPLFSKFRAAREQVWGL